MKYIKIICLYLKKYISDKQFEKIFYQDIKRKQKIFKKINASLGVEEILEYLKIWKLLD